MERLEKGDIIKFDHKSWYDCYALDMCEYKLIPVWLWKILNRRKNKYKTKQVFSRDTNKKEFVINLEDGEIFIVKDVFNGHLCLFNSIKGDFVIWYPFSIINKNNDMFRMDDVLIRGYFQKLSNQDMRKMKLQKLFLEKC